MRAHKVDGNQGETVDYLRRLGWSVFITSHVGGGFPDLVVSMSGFTALVEIKDGHKPPSARKLTRGESQFAATWQGAIVLATSPEQAADALLVLWRGWKKPEGST